MPRKSIIWVDLLIATACSVAWYYKDFHHQLGFIGLGLLFGLVDSITFMLAVRHGRKRSVNWYNLGLIANVVVLLIFKNFVPALYGLVAGASFSRALVLIWYQFSTRRVITWRDVTA